MVDRPGHLDQQQARPAPTNPVDDLKSILAQREKIPLTTADKFAAFGQALEFFGSAINQFQGGKNTDPKATAHQRAVAQANKNRADIKSQVEGAAVITKFVTENVAPDQQIPALVGLGKDVGPGNTQMVRLAATAIRNPRGAADVAAGASVIAKLTQFSALFNASQNPETLKALGLTKEVAQQIGDLASTEGGIAQMAAFANSLSPDNPMHITDNEVAQLTTNPKVAARANQVLQAQPVEAFEAGEVTAAQVAAKRAGEAAKIPKSDLLDENKRLKPTAVRATQQLLGNIVGGAGIQFDAQGNMQVLDPQVGLQLGRMTGRAAELVRQGKGLPEATNQAAEEEGFDVSGERARGTKAEQARGKAAEVTVQQNVAKIRERLKDANVTEEQFNLTITLLRQGGKNKEADILEEERSGFFATIGRAIRGIGSTPRSALGGQLPGQ